MKAEDTIKKDIELDNYWIVVMRMPLRANEEDRKVAQAEISFKAGYEKCSEELETYLLKWKKEGIQEAVEWIEKHHWEESSVPGYIDYGFNEIPWKAQKKEWGL